MINSRRPFGNVSFWIALSTNGSGSLAWCTTDPVGNNAKSVLFSRVKYCCAANCKSAGVNRLTAAKYLSDKFRSFAATQFPPKSCACPCMVLRVESVEAVNCFTALINSGFGTGETFNFSISPNTAVRAASNLSASTTPLTPSKPGFPGL